MSEKIEGISGWLIVWFIGLGISVCVLIYRTIQFFEIDSDLRGGLWVIHTFMKLYVLLMLLFNIYVLWITFKKKALAIRLNKAFIWIGVIFQLLSIWYINYGRISVEDTSNLLIPTIIFVIVAVIWSVYWEKSQRVKNTFIRRVIIK